MLGCASPLLAPEEACALATPLWPTRLPTGCRSPASHGRGAHGPAHLGRTTAVMGVGGRGAWPVMDSGFSDLAPPPPVLKPPSRAPCPAPAAVRAPGRDPMGGAGGRRGDLPVQSPLSQRWWRVPGGRGNGTRAGEGAARERASCGCGPGLQLLPGRIADLAAQSPQRRVFPRHRGCASSRLLSLACKVALPSPDQVTFGLRDGSQEEVGVCGDGA